MGKLLKRLRLLLVVYAVAAVVALYEGAAVRDSGTGAARAREQKRRRDLLRDDREAELLGRIYPQRRDSNYLKGLRALLPRAGPPDPATARRYFERALAADEKDEDLLYTYAFTLDLLGEDPALVNAAVADWRRNFPFSQRAGPRSADVRLPSLPPTRRYAP